MSVFFGPTADGTQTIHEAASNEFRNLLVDHGHTPAEALQKNAKLDIQPEFYGKLMKSNQQIVDSFKAKGVE